MSMRDKCIFSLFLFLPILFSFYFHSKILPATSNATTTYQVVIDVGHGGEDPGKVGINNALEKDVNLAIAQYLAQNLKTAGYSVLLTRETDVSLADTDASNQKLSDLQNRVSLFASAAPLAVVSIHQNSYPSESVHGTQVFYSPSKESKELASCIQNQCIRLLDPENHRTIKENRDYYLFQHTTCPIVIVECGFLSNHREANLLINEDYQQKTAWAIYMGTVQFLKTLE